MYSTTLANDYLSPSGQIGDFDIEDMVEAIITQSKIDSNYIIDYIDGVQTAQIYEYNFTCKQFLKEIWDVFGNIKLARDESSLNIYIDNGDDKEPTQVCYWHEDEWLEDAESVVPAMLTAMELFYTNKPELLRRLKIKK